MVNALDDRAADFYRHVGFHDIVQHRLWRRLTDIAAGPELWALVGLHGRRERPR